MPKKRIYHGSEHIVEVPTFGFGTTSNDYGRGFYCTENIELAKEWACAKNTNGFANCYDLELKGLRVLNLNAGEYHILHWLALLTRYRSYWQKNSVAEEAKAFLQEHFLLDISDFDIIIGNRADDSYFSFAQDFIMGTISLEQLSRAMRLGQLGEQIVLKSRKSFEQLQYLKNEQAFCEEYFVKKTARDREARREYRDTKARQSRLNDTFMIDIMRNEVKLDDLRIR